MIAVATTKPFQSPKAPRALADEAMLPVIPLMSKEEGERLISQMPRRSSAEALAMMETVLERRMPLVKGGTRK
jgi:hypothetical protein